jgi:hypothetical protein
MRAILGCEWTYCTVAVSPTSRCIVCSSFRCVCTRLPLVPPATVSPCFTPRPSFVIKQWISRFRDVPSAPVMCRPPHHLGEVHDHHPHQVPKLEPYAPGEQWGQRRDLEIAPLSPRPMQNVFELLPMLTQRPIPGVRIHTWPSGT